jgi:hypothetical protein
MINHVINILNSIIPKIEITKFKNESDNKLYKYKPSKL